MRKLFAEFLGTLVLVFGGCGAAVLAGPGIGVVGIALAFGLTVVACAYALGPISGCHLNPAVTIGLWAGGRFPRRSVPAYLLMQVLGGIAAAGAIIVIASGRGENSYGDLAANGYDVHSPGHFGVGSAFIAEALFTFIFLMVILGVTSKRAAPGFAGLIIGLTLTLLHLIGIPVTNLSVNPAHSSGPALMVGGWAIKQVWLFWVAPIAGAALAGYVGRQLYPEDVVRADIPAPPEVEAAIAAAGGDR